MKYINSIQFDVSHKCKYYFSIKNSFAFQHIAKSPYTSNIWFSNDLLRIRTISYSFLPMNIASKIKLIKQKIITFKPYDSMISKKIINKWSKHPNMMKSSKYAEVEENLNYSLHSSSAACCWIKVESCAHSISSKDWIGKLLFRNKKRSIPEIYM